MIFYENETKNREYGKIIKFYLINSKIYVLLKKFEKKKIDFNWLKFNFENCKVFEKLDEFYCEIEETNFYKLVKIEHIISNCIVLKLKTKTVITTIVGKNNHD